MDFSSFLLENLLDCYENYCSCVQKMESEEIDSMFFDEEGNELSDKDFFFENYEDILEDDVVEALYCYICEIGEQAEIDLERIISFLCGRYLIYNYNKNAITNYLRNNDIKDIINLFIENVNFGTNLLKDHFNAMLNPNIYNDNYKKIQKNKDDIALNKFVTKAYYNDIKTLNNLLRGVVCRLYDFYIESGYDDEEALNRTWLYFFHDFDPLGELDKMGIDYDSKCFYKRYAIALILSDLYEDVSNDPIIKCNSFEEQSAQMTAILAINLEVIAIPSDQKIANRVLKHFILLQDEKKKMEDNRKKTYEEGRIKELKKLNPLYKLDEMHF